MIHRFAVALFYFLLVLSTGATELSEKLEHLSTQFAFTFEVLETDSFFTEKYLLRFEQVVDHTDPQSTVFSQRVFLSHRSFEAPVVLITEGYAADYGAFPAYVNELSRILESNQVTVEHRYFGESAPDADWQFLTVYNAATDHHRIAEALKNIYPGKWVNTGISKGGQTAMFHRTFYPDDVDATVGYVCPLNFSVEDKRVYRFLEQVGTEDDRAKIKAYQLEMLKNKDRYLPEFKRMAQAKHLSYRMGLEKAYELTVLEYSFAFWQWGNMSIEGIPAAGTYPADMLAHLDRVAGISWISNEGIQALQPFFYQALVEIGFYGYDISGFEEWISYTENPGFEFSAPEGVAVTWNPATMIRVDQFMRHEAEHVILIYGETDPWSATAVDVTWNNSVIKVVKPGGSHITRISNLPDDQRERVIGVLREWLEVE